MVRSFENWFRDYLNKDEVACGVAGNIHLIRYTSSGLAGSLLLLPGDPESYSCSKHHNSCEPTEDVGPQNYFEAN